MAVSLVREDGDRAVPEMFVLLRTWQRYLEASGRCNERTRRQYLRTVLVFVAETLLDLRSVSEEDVVHWLLEQDSAGRRSTLLRALHSFYDWATDREVCASPVKRIPVPKEKYGPAPSLTSEELERVLSEAEKIDPRARPTLALMYYTGARVGSIAGLTPNDVIADQFGRRSVKFRVAKGGKPYTVPVEQKEAIAALDNLLALSREEFKPLRGKRRPTLIGVGTGTIWSWARTAGEQAGVKVYPHLLRHTFATRLAEDPDVDVRTWIELMNHSDGSLMRRYAQPSSARLRGAVKRLGHARVPEQG